ncbi:hypothetical protein [Dyadobacter frigoris]|uniref:Uncharacterized protein n=1 Tax=Dyadobacter frigoris TaxID=2576211 RepID=A0A4U6DBC1_9BACT|nr:hypothetical protein [Dyadobacter frigoris]TKT93518.1 hypothetical protein FDK13_06650 [Dyadobacter frigoris]GLU55749.1 hypothetical protein Dfri01_52100 [Dyadobacter frigoris]
MFYFNSNKFDFWEIYDCIKRNYPLSIKKDETGFFSSYPGLIELGHLLTKKFSEGGEYKKFTDFLLELESNIGKKIEDTTYGQAPSYSGYLEFETFTHENHKRTKELHFYISVLGPFYTIVGMDKNTVTVDWMTFQKPTYLIISPGSEYKENFIFLENNIERQFPGYKFVPYDIYSQNIEGLEVYYDTGNFNTVFNGIFASSVDFNSMKIGDEFYKYGQWLKK